MSQKDGQAFDRFLTELRKAVKTTGYQDSEEMVRDRIVRGNGDMTNQERLLRESKLNFAKKMNCK